MKKLFKNLMPMLLLVAGLGISPNLWGASANFTPNECLFVQGDGNGAWEGNACVKLWFHESGSSTIAPGWLYDKYNGSNLECKMFYIIVPSGTNSKVRVQRWANDCSTWWNETDDINHSARSNNIITAGSNSIAWRTNSYYMYLYGSLNSWDNSIGTLVDQKDGAPSFKYTTEEFVADKTEYEFRIKDNYDHWYGEGNVKIDGFEIGVSYTITATFNLSSKSLTLAKTQKTFSVTASSANTNMGTVSPASAWVGSSAVTFTATPKTGYHWTSWSKTGGASPSNAATSSVTATADGTITANFAANTYTVTLDNKGATTAGSASVTATYNAAMPSATMPTKTGYTFGGYYDGEDGAGTQYYTSAGASAHVWDKTDDATLYAQWTEVLTSVTISSNGNGTVSPTSASVGVATTESVSATPADGYHFASWAVTGNADIKGATTSNPVTLYGNGSGSTGTLTATFAETTYEISVAAGANGSVASNSVSAGQITPVALPKATPADGYNFKNWTATEGITITNANSADEATITATKAGTVTANFESAATYSLTVATNPAAAFTASSGSADNITLNTPYSISATLATTGYTFSGWTAEPVANASFGNKNDLSTTVTVNNGSVTVTANAQAKTTTLTLHGNGGLPNEQVITATYDQPCPSFTTPERTGYTYGGFTTEGTSSIVINQNGTFPNSGNYGKSGNLWGYTTKDALDIYAKWTATHSTQIELNKNFNAGKRTGEHGKAYITFDATAFDEGFTHATSSVGFTLLGYSTDAEGTNMVVNADGTFKTNVANYTDENGKWINPTFPEKLYAQWEEFMTTVALSANPEGAGKFYVSNSLANEATVGISTTKAVRTAAIDENAYTFTSWTATNCSVENPTSSTGGQLSGDGTNATGTLVANFALIPCNLVQLNAAKTSKSAEAKNTFVMQYDNDKKAYYVDVTPDASPFYFYFNYNEHKYSTDWKDKWQGGYTSGAEVSVSLGVTPTKATIMNDAIDGWDDLPSIVSKACSSYPIRVWFDYNNKKTWITADAETQWSIAGSNELGDWSTSQNVMIHAGASSVLWNLTVALDAKKEYILKVVNRATGEYYGGTNTLTKDKTTTDELGTNPSAANITLTTTVAGNYQFQWSTNTKKLTVTYPSSYAVNFGKGTGGATVTAKIDNTTDITTGELVISGSSVTFAQTAATGYTFKEWNTKQDGTGNQLSTDASYTTTIDAITNVYAIYTENMHTNIAVESNDNNKGTVNVTSVEFGIATGATITATPKAGYYVASWTLPEHAVIASGEGTGTITVKASGDEAVVGTITANFAERWVLRGSRSTGSENEGMPGFSTTTDVFTFAADATEGTKTVTLLPNRQYKFIVYDKKHSAQRGYANENQTLPANTLTGTMNGTYHILMNTAGYGEYIFTVQEESTDAGTFPKVKITNPSSYQITMGVLNVTEGCAETLDGGTLTAKTVEKIENVDTEFTVSKDQYVREGGSVTFTATAYDGYDFAGFYSNADCTNPITDGVTNNTYTTTIIAATSVYAKFSERLYDVSVFDGVNNSTVQAGVASHPQIEAQRINGKKFTKWTLYGVGVENDKVRSTKINYVDMGVNDHRATATYGDLDAIYFNNKIEGTGDGKWNPTEMYVYFYKAAYPYFDNSGAGSSYNGGGSWDPTCMMKKGIPMTKIEGTTIWKAEYDKEDDEYFAYSSEDIKMVAFNDHRQDNTARFTGCSVVYVDFNSCMNMYVQDKTEGFAKKDGENSPAWYRNNGFWKNYNAPSSGLYVNVEESTNKSVEMALPLGDETYSGSVHIAPNNTSGEYKFYFYVGSCAGVNYSVENGEIRDQDGKRSITLYKFEKNPKEAYQQVTVYATAEGSYTFTVKHNDNNTLTLSVEYPLGLNDYRVVSNDGVKGHDNGYLYKHSSVAKDELASFFVKPSMTVKLQKCTKVEGTDIEWSDVAGQSISDFTADGYHNFKIHQNGSGNATLTDEGEYKGNFYLRTDVAPGGWSNYLTNAGNIMQENEYGLNDAQTFKFTHAYTNHVGHGGNVKFVIANDYSKCITDTLTNQNDVIVDASGNLPSGKDANVRFMWNKNDNTVARAYIGGSALTTDRYLVLLGNKDNSDKSLMVDEHGTPFPDGGAGREGLHADEAIFTDLGNWIYQVNIKAFSGAAVKLMADFAGKTQYFVGADGEEEGSRRQIMAGESTESFPMRVVYDFKSNRLVAGFVPDGNDITGNIVLNGDLLILREMQKDAKQIKFGEAAQGKDPYSISQIDHIYCGLQINKGHAGQNDGMIGSTNNDYAKTMYWISFPFDVNINEIFGLDGYGQKWIIQKYRGDLRAQKGWFKEDTPTFWEFMDYNETMKAYEGYLFLLDANYFNETNDEVWQIGSVDHITFYFPSASGNIGIINKSEYTQEVPAHKCDIKRQFNIGTEETPIMVSHEQTDSYWNVIGVPAFQNKTMALSTEEVSTDMKAIYEWNSSDNTYNVKALKTAFEFKTMYAYMVQFGGDITWSDVSVVNNPTEAQGGSAPRYAYADEKNYMVELFFNGNNAEDHTYINLADEASTDFVLNEDMMKLDNAGFPNIYSFAGNYNVAYNETKMDNQTVTLGVSAPKAGTYTFAMPNQFSGTAKLIDLVEGIATDLNISDYSVDLNKGTYNDRFQLLLEVEAKAPTSVEATGDRIQATGKTLKLLRNGNIYLINAGRVYNATGAELR